MSSLPRPSPDLETPAQRFGAPGVRSLSINQPGVQTSDRRVPAGWCALIGLLSLFWLAGPADADPLSREYQLKAGLIYNIIQFVEWPRSRDFKSGGQPLHFCVAGKDRFENYLERMARQFKKKNIRMEIHRNVHNPLAFQCHLLFIDRTAVPDLDRIMQSVEGKAVLLIADTEGVAQRGVTVNFKIIANKIRFEINPCTTTPRGLWINAELLNLAQLIPCNGKKAP